MKVLILGVTGMLGYSLFTNLSDNSDFEVYGTLRHIDDKKRYFEAYQNNLIEHVDVSDTDGLKEIVLKLAPDVVINCIGLIKQYDQAKNHISAVTINSLFPHQVANICSDLSVRFIHFSTDCVFDGKKGNYVEEDWPNALDLYGASKRLGEVSYGRHLTLRTSIIGHGVMPNLSLIDWFLGQDVPILGFSKAIFSGLPTCYIAELLAEKILPNPDLLGLYHLSVNPINKYDLLQLVKKIYAKDILLVEDNNLSMDRSLNSDKLRTALELSVPAWESLIKKMNVDFLKRYER